MINRKVSPLAQRLIEGGDRSPGPNFTPDAPPGKMSQGVFTSLLGAAMPIPFGIAMGAAQWAKTGKPPGMDIYDALTSGFGRGNAWTGPGNVNSVTGLNTADILGGGIPGGFGPDEDPGDISPTGIGGGVGIGGVGGTLSNSDPDDPGDAGGVDTGDADCYITTACCKYLGMEDDCSDLTALRHFRDTYMSGNPLVDEYYETAPAMVEEMKKLPGQKQLHEFLYHNYIRMAVKLIAKGQNEAALKRYKQMVDWLRSIIETPEDWGHKTFR